MNHGDIEPGEEPIEAECRTPSGVVVSVRLSQEDADALMKMAEREDRTLSQVVRRAIRNLLKPAPTVIPSFFNGQALTFGNRHTT